MQTALATMDTGQLAARPLGEAAPRIPGRFGKRRNSAGNRLLRQWGVADKTERESRKSLLSHASVKCLSACVCFPSSLAVAAAAAAASSSVQCWRGNVVNAVPLPNSALIGHRSGRTSRGDARRAAASNFGAHFCATAGSHAH